jgi:GT2 family glycosyltransferase
MFKREKMSFLGGYRQVDYCEDYDFILRALDAGVKVSKMHGACLDYRIRENSISRSNILKQFLYSRKLRTIYNNGHISDSGKIEKEFKKIDNAVKLNKNNRFGKSQYLFSNGIKEIKMRKFLSGISKVTLSFLTSRYTVIKFIDMIVYRIERNKTIKNNVTI